MNNAITEAGLFSQIAASVRIVLVTMTICCLLYPLLILGVGRLVTPRTAGGSLLRNDQGEIIGSEALAQGFTRPEYFWPRPSAVDYNASAAGGSNLSPTSPALRARAEEILARSAAGGKPLPADLVTASGSGLDPHITLQAASCQAQRVAAARGLEVGAVMELLAKHAVRPGRVFTPEPLVNVLLLNLDLDRVRPRR
ncbi:MAG: potassium-transporting ATPase subunit KdpC [Desulfobulbaceae bacterium]|nr:potassium-transporting ATPase subunit KdpC [Desulfobulbaceae bacterium]